MKCQLIQTTQINDDNKAEKAMLEFLKNLPEEYFVYRELKLSPSYHERVKGFEQKQPDFVVVAPEIGLLSIEVKDWNLTRNIYEWNDQYKIKVTQPNGKIEEIGNPVVQAGSYKYAFIDLLSGLNIFVESILAFPRVSQHEFLNRMQNIDLLRNPQSRFFLDIEKTIFKEDLDQSFIYPEKLLRKIVHKNQRFRPSTSSDIENVNKRILPNSFRIGDFTKRQANQQHLKMITQEQQKWIFNLDRNANYLLDVAGSGKTNALISKAIYVIDIANENMLPKILLTTYNKNLEKNIRRIFYHKIDSKERQKYLSAITIKSIPALMEEIVKNDYEISDISKYKKPNESLLDYENRLKSLF